MLYCGSVWQTLKTAGSSLLRRQREAQTSGGSLLPACHEFQKSQSLVLMTSSLFFYCGKQEDPLSQTPVVSQKVFEAAKLFQAKVFQAAVWFYDTRFVCIYFLKSRFLKRHTHCSFVYLLTYLQTSVRAFCFKFSHTEKKILGESCSRALVIDGSPEDQPDTK